MSETLPTNNSQDTERVPDDPEGYAELFEEISYTEGSPEQADDEK
jgi:hypothetical protein